MSFTQSFILDICGEFGFLSVIGAISLLQIRSRTQVPIPGRYDTFLGSTVRAMQNIAWVLLVSSVVLFIVCLGSTVWFLIK